MRIPILFAVASLVACESDRHPPSDRQAEVAARGAEVMPFDLDKTTHAFVKDSTGGVQTVTANDPADSLNVRLIREHLKHEAEMFSRGEFSDPGKIHGDDMPGLAELRGSAGKISVAYDEVPAGGRIRYTATDRGLLNALHRWFDAQTADHGRHDSH